MKFVAIGIVFLGGLGVLIWTGFDSIKVLTISKLLAGGHAGECRVDDGTVVSIDREADPFVFTVRSDEDRRLTVESLAGRPENLKAGIKVSIEGTYDPEAKKFIARQVLTKCPSRYEATGSADASDARATAPKGR